MPPLSAVALAYAGVSLVTLVAFARDKSAARKGRRRTPERTLHLLSLAGGWPGALVAMEVFRHKRRKRPFVWTVRLIATAHLAAWVASAAYV